MKRAVELQWVLNYWDDRVQKKFPSNWNQNNQWIQFPRLLEIPRNNRIFISTNHVLIVSQYIEEFPIIEELGLFSIPVLRIYNNRGPNNQGPTVHTWETSKVKEKCVFSIGCNVGVVFVTICCIATKKFTAMCTHIHTKKILYWFTYQKHLEWSIYVRKI